MGSEGRQCLEGSSGIRDGWRGGDRWEDKQGAWRDLLIWGSNLSPLFREQIHSFFYQSPASADSLVGLGVFYAFSISALGLP